MQSESSPLKNGYPNRLSYYDSSNGWQFLMPYTTSNYQIYMRFLHNTSNNNWKMIYPNYSSILLNANGYIDYTNGLKLQWMTFNSSDYLDEYNYHYFPFTFPITMQNRTLYINYSPYDSSTVGGRIERVSTYNATVATRNTLTNCICTIFIIGN